MPFDFSNINVLIVGDVMLDRYLWGTVERISPEAPVPIVNLEKTTFKPGGAANVAANVAGLGAKAFLFGIVGDDTEKNLLSGVLTEKNVSHAYLYSLKNRPTTVKTRIIGHNQQIVRIDFESKAEVEEVDEKKILKKISSLLNKANILIISDYGKGFLTEALTARLIKLAVENKIKILVDPKGKNFKKYKNATLLTPNRNEVLGAYPFESFDGENKEASGKKILKEINLESLLITEGENGMTLFQKGKKPVHFSSLAREVYDVTGAGDTVIACLAVLLADGETFETAAEIANIAAGLSVEQIGTTVITSEMLKQSVNY